jgi:hypothetical protein
VAVQPVEQRLVTTEDAGQLEKPGDDGVRQLCVEGEQASDLFGELGVARVVEPVLGERGDDLGVEPESRLLS